MKRFLFTLVLLLITGLVFANPFVGRWKVGEDRYAVTDNHISGIMDGQSYESDYTYTDRTWVWKDLAWTYRFIDANHILVVGINPEGRPWYWMILRDSDSDSSGI